MSATPNTIPQSTDAEMRKVWRNKKARASKIIDIDADQKFAAVVILLNPAVSQPGDYATLGAAINAITGIEGVKMIVDGQTPASIPGGEKLVLATEVAVRQQTIPVPPEVV